MTGPGAPLVSIIVLNWNNWPDTNECLQSLRQIEYPNCEVTVVDNGSTDGSAEAIAQSFPEFELLRLPENLGYAGGNNGGISHVLRRSPDYVFVLNNDTAVHPHMLAELVATCEQDPSIGMAGPLLHCWNNEKLFAAGSFVEWAKGELRHRGIFEPASDFEKLAEPEEVDFLVGCGVLVRREFIEADGGLDCSYYLNFEDVDWCIRAKSRGYKVVLIPRAVMWHKVSSSLGIGSPANTYYMTRNRLLFFWKNCSPSLRLLTTLRILARTLRTVAAWTVREQYRSETFRRKRLANLMAIRDFFLGRLGRMGKDVQRICYD